MKRKADVYVREQTGEHLNTFVSAHDGLTDRGIPKRGIN